MRKVITISIFLFSLLVHGKETLVESYESSLSDCSILRYYTVCASNDHKERINELFNIVRRTEIGREYTESIKKSGHRMLIMHLASTVYSAGKTLVELSLDTSNGKGRDVVMQMNFDIPESGSHRVKNSKGEFIEFTAAQNFFHELSHAKHKMGGTWLSFDSEGQAIEDENIYRLQEARINNVVASQRDSDRIEEEIQIWFEKD